LAAAQPVVAADSEMFGLAQATTAGQAYTSTRPPLQVPSVAKLDAFAADALA
jgi:hypothetical protein